MIRTRYLILLSSRGSRSGRRDPKPLPGVGTTSSFPRHGGAVQPNHNRVCDPYNGFGEVELTAIDGTNVCMYDKGCIDSRRPANRVLGNTVGICFGSSEANFRTDYCSDNPGRQHFMTTSEKNSLAQKKRKLFIGK